MDGLRYDSQMMVDKDNTADELAQSHFRVEPDIVAIHRVVATQRESSESEPVKLLEVNEHTPSAGICPVHFGPDPAAGIYHASVVIEVTPEEYGQIQRG